MPRGGRRSGRPGAKYPNRTDLALAPRTAVEIPGQGYGEQAAQVAALACHTLVVGWRPWT